MSRLETHGVISPKGGELRLRVLIVDDDEDIRDSLKIILELEGYAVGAAADGPGALAALEVGCFDAALVDIGLPGMDGYALARRIREKFGPDRLHLVAVTGYGRPTDRAAALRAGFDAHLTKPIRPRELDRYLKALSRKDDAGAPPAGSA